MTQTQRAARLRPPSEPSAAAGHDGQGGRADPARRSDPVWQEVAPGQMLEASRARSRAWEGSQRRAPMKCPGCPGGQTRPLGPADIIIGALMGAGSPTLVGVGDGGGPGRPR